MFFEKKRFALGCYLAMVFFIAMIWPSPAQALTKEQIQQGVAHPGVLRFVDTHMHLHPVGLDQAMGAGGKGGGQMGDGSRQKRGFKGRKGKKGSRNFQGKKSGMNATENLAKAADNLIARMDNLGIAQSIVVVVPSSKQGVEESYRSLREAVSRHPGRLRLMAGGALLQGMLEGIAPKDVTQEDKQKFRQQAEKLLQEGAVGFGEMISYHLCMTQNHSFHYVPPNHPLFLLLADIAAQHDVPIDIHMEAVEAAGPIKERLRQSCSKNPQNLSLTIPDFEELLEHNPGARIVWQHIGWDNTGQMTPELVRRLMEKHPNLYLAIRIPNKILDENGQLLANRIVDKNRQIRPEWKQLLEDFHDRSMAGSDEFIGPSSRKANLAASFESTWSAVNQLPGAVMEKVGGGNAKRVYHLEK